MFRGAVREHPRRRRAGRERLHELRQIGRPAPRPARCPRPRCVGAGDHHLVHGLRDLPGAARAEVGDPAAERLEHRPARASTSRVGAAAEDRERAALGALGAARDRRVDQADAALAQPGGERGRRRRRHRRAVDHQRRRAPAPRRRRPAPSTTCSRSGVSDTQVSTASAAARGLRGRVGAAGAGSRQRLLARRACGCAPSPRGRRRAGAAPSARPSCRARSPPPSLRASLVARRGRAAPAPSSGAGWPSG